MVKKRKKKSVGSLQPIRRLSFIQLTLRLGLLHLCLRGLRCHGSQDVDEFPLPRQQGLDPWRLPGVQIVTDLRQRGQGLEVLGGLKARLEEVQGFGLGGLLMKLKTWEKDEEIE